MYIRKTSNKTHTKYSCEEKEKIVLLYLNHEMGMSEIVRTYDLADDCTLYRWVRNYKKNGKIVDGRGKATKFNSPKKGRPRKYLERPLEELSKDELIEKVRMLEDIKKSLVYLMSQSQK